MSTVITGANGKLGNLILQSLARKIPGGQITACVRGAAAAKLLEQQGFQVKLCDYDDRGSLEQALSGADLLLLISSSHPDDTVRLRQHTQVIEAAKQMKLKQLCYTSFAFAGSSEISTSQMHLATEHAIKESGIPYTIFRNALYTDFVSALGIAEAVKDGQLRVFPGDWKFNAVTREDLAAAIVAVLTTSNSSAYQNKTLELTAPSPWTFADLAGALSELAGRPVSVATDGSIQNWIYGFLRNIDTASTTEDLIRLTGGRITSLKESVKPFISS